ncbi:MAG: Fur family transcriptional regulator [Planctomycetota bacterium]
MSANESDRRPTDAAPTLAAEVDEVERRLRASGFRWTAQRRRIAEAIFATHEHFDAEELLAMCRELDSTISRATIYRTLAVLEAAGFVESLEVGEGKKRFEHVLGHEHHDHMICRDCGKIVEFVDPELEELKARVAARAGFRLVSHELKLFVECPDSTCPSRRHVGSEPPRP